MDAKMYLFSGVTMSAELEANAKTERRFITVGGYIDIGVEPFQYQITERNIQLIKKI